MNQWGCFQLIRTGVRPEEVLQGMTPKFASRMWDAKLGLGSMGGADIARHSHVFRKIVIPAHLKYEVPDQPDASDQLIHLYCNESIYLSRTGCA